MAKAQIDFNQKMLAVNGEIIQMKTLQDPVSNLCQGIIKVYSQEQVTIGGIKAGTFPVCHKNLQGDDKYLFISAMDKIQSDILVTPKPDRIVDTLSLLNLSHNPLTVQKGQCLGWFKSFRDPNFLNKLSLSYYFCISLNIKSRLSHLSLNNMILWKQLLRR